MNYPYYVFYSKFSENTHWGVCNSRNGRQMLFPKKRQAIVVANALNEIHSLKVKNTLTLALDIK